MLVADVILTSTGKKILNEIFENPHKLTKIKVTSKDYVLNPDLEDLDDTKTFEISIVSKLDDSSVEYISFLPPLDIEIHTIGIYTDDDRLFAVVKPKRIFPPNIPLKCRFVVSFSDNNLNQYFVADPIEEEQLLIHLDVEIDLHTLFLKLKKKFQLLKEKLFDICKKSVLGSHTNQVKGYFPVKILSTPVANLYKVWADYVGDEIYTTTFYFYNQVKFDDRYFANIDLESDEVSVNKQIHINRNHRLDLRNKSLSIGDLKLRKSVYKFDEKTGVWEKILPSKDIPIINWHDVVYKSELKDPSKNLVHWLNVFAIPDYVWYFYDSNGHGYKPFANDFEFTFKEFQDKNHLDNAFKEYLFLWEKTNPRYFIRFNQNSYASVTVILDDFSC